MDGQEVKDYFSIRRNRESTNLRPRALQRIVPEQLFDLTRPARGLEAA
jgi:hypothetical protein